MNYFKTFTLMAVLTIIFVLLGNYIGGNVGMIYAFCFALFLNFFSYWFSDKIVLAMYGAKPVTKEQAPKLYNMVHNLAIKAGLPMPKLYIIEDNMANAFATGRDHHHAAVAVTRGILNILDDKELEAVIAHELSHIKNYDILLGTLAATIAGAITMLARMAFFFGSSSDDNRGNALAMILLLILAPIAALLIQLAISRSREYAADNGSADITGRPHSLISALEKLHAMAKRTNVAHIDPATSHMLIVNPFRGDFLASLFSTHPTLEQRKRNLMKRN
ncbi:MAG: zinc metalloprotease HtpX [Candidatus Goldbacteria bacterium]|nr:zinc metalloprotease HtpX [Candidatus Goldiibacteriota bacterium]